MHYTRKDFYAHTNWVELGNTSPNPFLGRRQNLGVDIGLPYDDSCEDCPAVNCVNMCEPFTKNCTDFCFDSGTGCFTIPWTRTEVCGPLYACKNNDLSNRLTSGFAGGENMVKPDGVDYKKCSHGGFLDTSSHTPAKGGINKDTNSNLLSPHYQYHLQAANMAKEATLAALQDIWDVVGDMHFGRYLGILGSNVGSMVIVMDTTGSMTDEIEAAKASAKHLADEMSNAKQPPNDYVLSPFNDPSVGPLTVGFFF